MWIFWVFLGGRCDIYTSKKTKKHTNTQASSIDHILIYLREPEQRLGPVPILKAGAARPDDPLDSSALWVEGEDAVVAVEWGVEWSGGYGVL